jgi:predicted anti-sigma-YlaC factor YlaD
MNCFEARQDFRSFWRKDLAPERRGELVAHLAECSRCDGAFRTFALTAPVLHSEAEPARATPTLRRMPASSRRDGRAYRQPSRSAAWVSIAAVVALFVTGASAAYYSVETPTETLSDAIHQPSQSIELVSADFPETNSDFGQ